MLAAILLSRHLPSFPASLSRGKNHHNISSTVYSIYLEISSSKKQFEESCGFINGVRRPSKEDSRTYGQFLAQQRAACVALEAAPRAWLAAVRGYATGPTLLGRMARPDLRTHPAAPLQPTRAASKKTGPERPWERCLGRGAVSPSKKPPAVKKPKELPPLAPCLPKDPCEPDPCCLMEVLCKNAIVTGGATGIGLATCHQLFAEGAYRVVLADTRRKAGQRAESQLNECYGAGKATFTRADVGSFQEFQTLFENAINHLQRIDILVNNAAIFNDRHWEYAINANIKSVMGGCCLAMQHMSAENGGVGGVVINLAATFAWDRLASMPVFCASKRAVLGLTESFGDPERSDATKVRVMSLCPGVTHTGHLSCNAACHLQDAWAVETKRRMRRQGRPQPKETAARALTMLVRYGCSGRHYVVEGGVVSELWPPSRKEISRDIALFV